MSKGSTRQNALFSETECAPYSTKESSVKKQQWNPRYELYARAHNLTPRQQLRRDRRTGAYMIEFSFWIQRKWDQWWEQFRSPDDPKCIHNAIIGESEHLLFDKWLATHYSATSDEQHIS